MCTCVGCIGLCLFMCMCVCVWFSITLPCSYIHCDSSSQSVRQCVCSQRSSGKRSSPHTSKQADGGTKPVRVPLRTGSSPLCSPGKTGGNIHRCRTLVPLTFLHLTVENLSSSFPFILFPCLRNYQVPIWQRPHSHPQYPQGPALFLLPEQLPRAPL